MPTPRTPANQRQRTWRAQAVQPEQTARRRRVFRVLLPLVGICLLGLLAWVLIARFLRPPRLDLIAIAVADYRNPEVPPIAYCYEDLEALRKVLDADRSGQSSLWNDATSEGFAELGAALRETSNSHDNVLVYIKAHGVSLNGAAYLLGGDFELGVADAGRLLIDDLLRYVAESPANIKLLVLDTGHLESDPPMGMLTNEFMHLLTQAVQRLPANSNVWVLTSNSVFERAQVSLADKRSAFGYYLAEGLKGRSDGVLAGKDGEKAADRLIQLDELYQFVRDYVVQYVRVTSDDRQAQTPLLLRAGTGEVTDAPHEVLLRIEATEEPDAKAAEEKKVASRSSVGLFRSDGALALVGNQAPSGAVTEEPTKASPAQPVPAASTQSVDQKTAEDTGKEASKELPQVVKDDGKAKGEPAGAKAPENAAATATNAAQKPVLPIRTPLEQSLFDYDKWLHDQESRANEWRPTDYAPDLARLYCESLAGCRDRALAGSLFLNSADYQGSLNLKLKELATLQDEMAARFKDFQSGVARPTYERDDQVRVAIRTRNEVCHLLPLLIRHHAALSENTDPTMGRDLSGLIEATAELDRLLAASLDQRQAGAQQSFESWKQTLVARAAQARGQMDKLRGDFQARYDEQQRLINQGGNAFVSRRLADLAQSPLATPERREELQKAARSDKIAYSFAEVEKQTSQPVRPLPAPEQQRLTDLAWGRALARGELELALAAFLLGDNQDANLAAARQALTAANQAAEVDARLTDLRKIDEFLHSTYRRVPERLGERLRSKSYSAMRAAETAIRLADARDQKRIEKVIGDRATLDPIIELRLAALPELTKTYRLALGDASSISGGSMALNFGVAERLAVRFISNAALPDRLRLRLKYDTARLQVKDAQGAALGSETVREFPLGAVGGGSSATEHRLELLLDSRDQRGERTNLTVIWLDENNRELAQNAIALAHPEPVLAKLAVFGQRFTADHTWQTSPNREFYFDVPFNEGIGHVRLMPYSGHESRYDFRLTNTAKHPKNYTVAVYSIPTAAGGEQQTSLAALVTAAETRGKVLGRSELPIDPGQTRSVRFDSPQPAPKDSATAKSEADKLAAAKEPPPDITAGLVCVLTEVSKPAQGGQPQSLGRQVIVIEAEVQPPRFYITPRLVYRNSEIAAVLSAPDVDRLPENGARVELEVQSDQVRPDPRARYVTQLTKPNRTRDTLSAFVRPGATSQAKVSLHVDDYPRAFIYEFPLDASLQDVPRKLDLRDIALPDEKAFPVYLPGRVTEPVKFPFSVDLPPAGERSNRVRVFIASSPTSDYDPSTLMLESFEDRAHRIELINVEDAPILALRAHTSDLHAMLDLGAYENQPLFVRVQLLGVRQGEETVLADDSVKVYLDGQPPTVEAYAPTRGVEEKIPFAIRIDARDDVSGVRQVEFALEKQPNPDPKSSDAEVLVKPSAKGIRAVGGTYQLTHVFEKPGLQTLYVQATDMCGNKSEIKEVEVSVRPTPVATDTKGATVPVAQLGQIAGRAALPDGARGDIKLVILKDAGGRAIQQQAPGAGGSFFFDKVPPGQYTLEAKGFIGGNESKPAPVPVTVEAGKRASGIDVLLSR